MQKRFTRFSFSLALSFFFFLQLLSRWRKKFANFLFKNKNLHIFLNISWVVEKKCFVALSLVVRRSTLIIYKCYSFTYKYSATCFNGQIFPLNPFPCVYISVVWSQECDIFYLRTAIRTSQWHCPSELKNILTIEKFKNIYWWNIDDIGNFIGDNSVNEYARKDRFKFNFNS